MQLKQFLTETIDGEPVFEFIHKMKKPLTDLQIESLEKKYSFKDLKDVLEGMENFMKNGKTIDKCYVSTNLTARKWLGMRTTTTNSLFDDLDKHC